MKCYASSTAFDHYAIGDILGKWSTGSLAGSTASAIDTTTTRTGAGALRLGGSGTIGDWVNVPVGAAAPTVICGFGFRFASATNQCFFFVLGDGGTTSVGAQIGLRVTTAGLLELYRNNNAAGSGMLLGQSGVSASVLIGTSVSALSANQWNYLEVKATIHNSSGAAEVRVNGSPWITFAGDTQFTANAWANVVGLGGLGAAATFVDDLYVADDVAGDGVTTWLGPQKVGTVLASAGNGTQTDFTPSTGTDHGALVDEATPNGDTDYVSSMTVGHRDSYQFPALSVAGTVTAVQALAWAKQDVSGARAINGYARIGTTNYDHPAPVPLDTTYRAARSLWTTSPATAGPWTLAEIEAAEFGVRVQA